MMVMVCDDDDIKIISGTILLLVVAENAAIK